MSRPSPAPLPTSLVVKNGSKIRETRSVGMPRDLDNHGVFVVACPDEDPAASVQGIDGVINQICPHLIQLRPIRLNSWQALVILADDLDSWAQLVPKHQKRFFDAFVHIDLLLWSSVHVRVLFDGPTCCAITARFGTSLGP